ncbi:beta-ketoacyl-[acyl-carrier-protein] synthase family protein [Streptomyces mutabilis]|uniref:beta-ketoacyl-[acyl-carrier-protein] synthase family protein n=1 Tax=Streptomyces mutabilis TaxID=67332 RepID=UPI002FD76802
MFGPVLHLRPRSAPDRAAGGPLLPRSCIRRLRSPTKADGAAYRCLHPLRAGRRPRGRRGAGLTPTTADPTRIGVVLGVASGSFTGVDKVCDRLWNGEHHLVSPLFLPRILPSVAAGEIAARHDYRGPDFTVTSACASGGHAIGVARDLIRSGTCDIVLAGGAESARAPVTAISFARMGALSTRLHDPDGASRPFDRDRDGFVLGEGAAVLVLEDLDHARARGAALQGIVAGYGASADAHHPVNPHPDGGGLQQAIEPPCQMRA